MSNGLPDVSELNFAEGSKQWSLEEFHVQKRVDKDLLLLCGFTISALQQNMLLNVPLAQNPYLSYQYLRRISRAQQRLMEDLLCRHSPEVRAKFAPEAILDANPAWKDTYVVMGIILNHFRYMHQKHLGDLAHAAY